MLLKKIYGFLYFQSNFINSYSQITVINLFFIQNCYLIEIFLLVNKVKEVWSIKTTLELIILEKYNRLIKDYKSLSIKEITSFKHLKSISKLSFKYLMMQSSRNIHSFIVSPDKRFLISGEVGGTIKLFDFNTLKIVKIFNFHTSMISSLDIESLSNFFLSSSFDKKICLWNLNSLKLCLYIEANEFPIIFPIIN